MKFREIAFLLLGGVVGFVCLGLFRACMFSGPEQAPMLGGQEVPKENFLIDFSRRYNVVVTDYNKGSRTYENAKILGYTGETVRESSGGYSKGYGHFGRWLVIELPDRRRAYLSPGNIAYLEEVEPSKTP
jgi:hypothetical protein